MRRIGFLMISGVALMTTPLIAYAERKVSFILQALLTTACTFIVAKRAVEF